VAYFIFRVLLFAFMAYGALAEPNILDPGPQLATYPTNTSTLQQGTINLEYTPFAYEGGRSGTPGQNDEKSGTYYNQFMAHIGATDEVELRVYGSGLAWGEAGSSGVNFSPLSFSTLVSIWHEHDEYPYLPAFSVEASINTELLGNSTTNSGTNPGVQFAFSKDFPWDTNLNISMGPMRSRVNVGNDENSVYKNQWDFLFQWALSKVLIEKKLSGFFHGYYNGTNAVSIPAEGQGPSRNLFGVGSTVIGGGLIWTVTDRLSMFGQVSGGINSESPSILTWYGLAVAF